MGWVTWWRRIERWLGFPAPRAGPAGWWVLVVLSGLGLMSVGVGRASSASAPSLLYGVALVVIGASAMVFGAADALKRGSRGRRAATVRNALRAARASAFVAVLAAALAAALALLEGGG